MFKNAAIHTIVQKIGITTHMMRVFKRRIMQNVGALHIRLRGGVITIAIARHHRSGVNAHAPAWRAALSTAGALTFHTSAMLCAAAGAVICWQLAKWQGFLEPAFGSVGNILGGPSSLVRLWRLIVTVTDSLSDTATRPARLTGHVLSLQSAMRGRVRCCMLGVVTQSGVGGTESSENAAGGLIG